MKPSRRHEIAAEKFDAFRGAYVDLLNSCDFRNQKPGTPPTPIVDGETWALLHKTTAETAGAASIFFSDYGIYVATKDHFNFTTHATPSDAWFTSINNPQQVHPSLLIACIESGYGKVSLLAEQARVAEKGIKGIIASFIRWPSDLAEAVGPRHPIQTNVARSIGLLGQVLVGVLVYYVVLTLNRFLQFLI